MPGPRTYPTTGRWVGLATGSLALVAELAAPGLVRAVSFGPLWVNAFLLLGLASLLLHLFEGHGQAIQGRLFLATAPFLAAGILARLLYMDPGSSQTVVLREAAIPETLALATGLLAAWAATETPRSRPRGALTTVTITGTLAATVLAGAHVWRVWPVATGPATVLLLTLALVGLCLAIQRSMAKDKPNPRIAALATGTGLAVAGGQLLDGIVTYLAVVDPAGLLAAPITEGVATSRAILSAAGPLFPLLKWLLGAGAVALIEPAEGADPGPWWHRFALLTLVLFVGLGPGLFSSLRVLGA